MSFAPYTAIIIWRSHMGTVGSQIMVFINYIHMCKAYLHIRASKNLNYVPWKFQHTSFVFVTNSDEKLKYQNLSWNEKFWKMLIEMKHLTFSIPERKHFSSICWTKSKHFVLSSINIKVHLPMVPRCLMGIMVWVPRVFLLWTGLPSQATHHGTPMMHPVSWSEDDHIASWKI